VLFIQLADGADSYLPQTNEDPPLAATYTSRDDTETGAVAASLFPAKGKGSRRDDRFTSVSSLELQQTTL